jgi:DNA-binding NarL/FixJ family response regulator
VTESEADER